MPYNNCGSVLDVRALQTGIWLPGGNGTVPPRFPRPLHWQSTFKTVRAVVEIDIFNLSYKESHIIINHLVLHQRLEFAPLTKLEN